MSLIEADILNCLKILQSSGTILYPTDTIWGIGCNALDELAVDKIYDIKQRPKERSFIILLAEPKDILQYVASPHPDIIDIIGGFDSPTTVIYEHALEFPENVVHKDGSIAIRVTDDPFCKTLIKRLRKPLISTSANLSGQPSPQFFNSIDATIKKNVDYVVKYRQEDITIRQPSRLVKIKDDGSLEILRP